MGLFGFGAGNQAAKNNSSSQRKHAVKAAVAYAFMPGIIPRIRRMGMNFGHFSYMLALIYGSCNLIPRDHPMLNPANIGRYGLAQVIATAANRLTLSRNNIDQIAIFFAILLAVVMIIIQLGILIFMMAIGTANASPTNGFFETPTAGVQKDTALTFLQNVFGISGFFNNNNMPGLSLANSFHQMLSFYSTAMMVIAVIIVLYYVFAVVGESARTGSPFGQRFNGLYAPLRLVLALGLLVPLPSGLNSGQYLVLHIANFGSGLATNAWNTFKTGLFTESNITFGGNQLNAMAANVTQVGKTVFMNELCMAVYNADQNSPQKMSMRKLNDGVTSTTTPVYDALGNPTGYSSDILSDAYVRLVWTRDPTATKSPVTDQDRNCGEVSFRYSYTSNQNVNEKISSAALKIYLEEVEAYANDIRSSAVTVATAEAGNATSFTKTDLETKINAMQTKILTRIGSLPIKDVLVQVISARSTSLENTGWGDASVWYMALASANQKIYSAIANAAPQLHVVQEGGSDRSVANTASSWWGIFYTDSDLSEKIERIMRLAQQNIVGPAKPRPAGTSTYFSRQTDCGNVFGIEGRCDASENEVFKVIGTLFQLQDLKNLADPNTAEQLPMIKLIQLGGSILTRAGEMFVAGGLASIVSTAVGNLIFFFAFLGLAQGFVLFYLLPLMPFIYFFFAMVEWVMGVAEAVINMPLWALAHLRIEGDGLPGPGANQGYFILFGILLKPILIVFALIIGFIIFNAGGFVLNKSFSSAVEVARDGEAIGGFGIIAYLIVYTIICYNLAMVSFKMIDQLPAQAFRWLGQGNPNFNDGKPDPVGNIGAAAGVSASLISGQMAGGVSSLIGGRNGGRFRGDPNRPPQQSQPKDDDNDSGGSSVSR